MSRARDDNQASPADLLAEFVALNSLHDCLFDLHSDKSINLV